MKIFFNKRFEEEVLSNEKLRITILICMLVFAMLYLLINISIEKMTATGKSEIEAMLLLLVFHCALLVFEILAWLRINCRIRKQQYSIQDFDRYLNSFIEICSPGLIIVILAKQYGSPMMI